MARGFTERDVPDQHGRTAVVTGANTGIGFEAARVLAARGARVLLGCRSEQRAEDAMARIRAATPDADVAFVALDQASLASVEAAAARVAEEPRLDVLVNNAGVMVPPLSRTEDGFELQLGVNHLGTFALTGRLLEQLAADGGGRVVTTSSLAHRGGQLFLDDLAAEQGYDAQARYGQSKLANLLFALELDRRTSTAGTPVTSIACHPGLAATELVRHMPRPLAAVAPAVLGLVFNTAAQGAWPTLQAATDPDLPGGSYVGPQRWRETAGASGPAQVSPRAQDPELARRLWDVSVELTGVDPGV